MAPFTFAPVVQGVKARVEAILCQGDQLYLGTSTGTLHIYSLSGQISDPRSNLYYLADI